jgi:hypothetical protein
MGLNKNFILSSHLQRHNLKHISVVTSFVPPSANEKHEKEQLAMQHMSKSSSSKSRANDEDEDFDYGYFPRDMIIKPKSSTITKTSASKPLMGAKKKDENVTYREIDVYFETSYELFTHFGSKLHRTSTRNMTDAITINSYSCTRFINDDMIIKLSEKTDLTKTEHPRADHATIRLRESKGVSNDEAETEAHEEGVHYILINVELPAVQSQLEKYTTKKNTRTQAFVQPVPRTNRFITRIFAGDISKIDEPYELCKFTTLLDCNDDKPQTVGLIYFDRSTEQWGYRSTNCFRPVPPKKLLIKVEELDQPLISSFGNSLLQAPVETSVIIQYLKQKQSTKGFRSQGEKAIAPIFHQTLEL